MKGVFIYYIREFHYFWFHVVFFKTIEGIVLGGKSITVISHILEKKQNKTQLLTWPPM